jgi:putative peptidoglycan lipid II flippase
LSKHHADAATDEYSKLLDWGLRLTLMLAAPAAAALAVLSVPLITTLFHYGNFADRDVAMTRQALVAYSFGLLGLILVKVLAPGFYARQNIRTPVRIAITTLVATQLMNAALIVPLRHAGLALSIGLAACLNAGLLYRKLREQGIYSPQPGWRRFGAKVALALAAMSAALWFAMGPERWWLGAANGVRAAAAVGLVLLGALVYFGMLWLVGFRTRDFSRREA